MSGAGTGYHPGHDTASAFRDVTRAIALRRHFRATVLFGHHVIRQFTRDRCLQASGSLAYTTLLALVPLFVIGLAMVSAFPVFADLRGQVQTGIFQNLVPQVGDAVQQYLDQFVTNAGKLTLFGTAGLAVTAVMLAATVEGVFNQIWRARRPRALSVRLMRYWTAVTLGPLLFGLSLTLPGYLFAAARQVGVEGWFSAISGAALFIPALAELIGFTLMYLALPNCPVRAPHAAIGGVAAMLVFEALKFGFALYVVYFPTYQAIYGPLSILPILLIWIYLAWLVVLAGAELTAALPAWNRILSRC